MEIVNNKIENIYPLTPLQYGMLFHNLYETDSSAYIIQLEFKIYKNIDPEIIKKALKLLSAKYSVLRTLFVYEKVKDACQVVLKERELEFDYIDLSNKKIYEQEALVKELLTSDVAKGFDLQKDTLIRLKCIKLSDKQNLLVFSNHHIIMDGWCNTILFKELFNFYERMSNGEKYNTILDEINQNNKKSSDYGDYLRWLGKQDKGKARKYWEKELEGYDNDSDIKRMIKPEATKDQIRECSIEIYPKITQKLKAIAGKAGSTINIVAETAVGIMLQRYSGSNDVVFGKVVSGRNADIPGIEDMVGLFINTIPLRVEAGKDETIIGLLKKQQKKSIESTNYDYYSLAEIQNMTIQGAELIKVLYVFENYDSGLKNDALANTGITVESSREKTNYGITISGFEDEGKLCFTILYDPNKYCKDEVELILERLLKICEEMADKPDSKVSEIVTVTEAEKQLILNDFNATETEYPRDKTVVELFEEQVKETPDNIALVFEDKELTYAGLNAKANSLAYMLRELGVKPDDFVAIIADRSIEIIEGIYGIIKAGGAYVPIDPTYPKDRISFILEDCKPKAVLKYTTESILLDNSIPVIDLADSKVWENELENPEHVNKANNLIYCIYTSGTMGKPKGVMVEHRNVIKLVKNCNYTELNEKTVILQTGQMMFDASTFEVWGAGLHGGTLHLVNKELMLNTVTFKKYMEEKGVNTMFITTALFNQFISEDSTIFNCLDHLMFGGEATSEKYVEILRTQGNVADFRNVYGPTETTTFATQYTIKEKVDKTPIGKPISNTQIYIANGDKLSGIGVPGELCIAGDGLARGYLNRSELTAEKFVKNPFGKGRMYRSGDLARWLPNGNIEYLGRIDEQIKIRGFRIELGEIENRIREIENIKDCAVIARADSTGEKSIYAYYTSDREENVSKIRDRLGESLPEYMVPSYMMQIEKIPVTKNGKIDKRALPEIEAKTTRKYVAPRNEIEEKICAVFSEILNVEQVGVKDGFFELGGHSLRATRLVNRIEAETGTRIALKDVFAYPTVEQLAVLAGAETEEYIPIPKAEEKEYYPMSSAQKRTYFIQQMQPEAVTYNMPGSFKLTGEVRPDAIRAALQAVTDRHEILRTVFLMIDGEPVQKILDHVEADFEYVTSSESDENLMTEFLKPFDLASGKLVRVKLVNKSKYHLLMFDMHHIVSDGMSMNIFVKEIMAICNGEKLEPLTHQFKDYSEWMRTRDLSNQAEYWKSQFYDEIPVLNMLTDYPRPQEQSYAGSKAEILLDETLSEKIKQLANKNEATAYMVFLAAAMVMLSKYSRQEDIVIGSPISGRTHKDAEGMLGMFVNTLAMRGKPEKNKTFSDFLAEIKETCLKAYENQEYPFEELVEAVDVQRDMSRNPLFDVMLILQNNESIEFKHGESKAELTGIEDTIAKFDLIFNIEEIENRFDIMLDYCTDLYKAETAKEIIKHFVEILKAVTSNEEQKLGKIEMVTAEEKSLILNDFNRTEKEYSRDKTVVELFEEQVKKSPDKTAVIFEGQKLTYAELNARANSLAHKLRELGVKPDDFVAIIADKSIEIIEGIYGIIKAGGAYVPIDPTYPEDRIAFMLEDCAPKAVLKYTTEGIELSAEVPMIDLGESEVWEGVSENPEAVNKPEDAIYCIYTSGTTGKPKGVVVEHHNVVKLVKNCDYTELNEESVILQTGQMMFDASTFEVWGAALNGGTLHLISKENMLDAATFKNYMIENGVNTLFITTALFNQFIGEDKTIFNCLKHLMFGGEATSECHVEILRSQNTGIDFRNVYGPTETTTFASHYIIKDKVDKTPIGKPVSNTQMYILNGNELCGIGVPGELCIAGDGVARGYLNRPGLNAEKFVKNPFGEGKMYRSGDLVRWLPDGNIEFLGRIDEQVKIHGFRIELGEIESRIREIENIKDCAVIAKADVSGDKAIYAYYTSDNEVSISEIRDRLSERLPGYMVPAYMMQIEFIPVTRNGKLDRRALPEIEVRAAKEYIAPRNEIEEKICDIFSEILNVEGVGVKDGFFELGGHSLRATRLVNRIEAETGTRIALKDVFAYPTAEQLAILAGADSEEYIPIPKAEEKEYYLMSSAQKRIYFIQQMQPDAVTYNMPGSFKLTGEVHPDALRAALQTVIDRHEILRTVFLMIDGEPVQKILDHVDADFEYVTSDGSDEKLIAEFLRPFELSSGKLVRVKLVDKGEYHLMMFDMHHIVSDGMSMNIFEKEVMALYNGEKLEPLVHQFKDYSEWMRSRDLSGQAEYWKSQFDDEIPVLNMPTDYSRPQEQSYAGTMLNYQLGEELSGKIRELVKNTGATGYMVLLAAAMVTLSKYSKQEDIVIGSPISGRTHKNTERMLGMFVNTLAMRGKPEKNKTFSQFLEEIKETCLKAYENQEYPFEELVEAVNVQRDMSRNPMFDVMLVLQNNESTDIKLGDNEAEGTGIKSTIAKFDMTFNIEEVGEKFYIVFEYCIDLFKEETAEQVVRHFEEVLKAVTSNAEQKLGDIEMVTETEKQLILNDFNATETEYPRDKTVVELFEEQVNKTPDNIALVFEDEKLTYEELNARVNSLAHKLREVGVKPDDFVAIIADRSIEMIVGIYGIIKAGGAYVPIDPTYTEDRIKYMFEDCAPKAVVIYTLENINIPGNIKVVDLADSSVWEYGNENIEFVNKPSDLAYCIYTSGTTGTPKGTMLEHHGVVNLKYYFANRMEINENDRVLQFANYIFDASVWEMTMALLNGAALVCVPRGLAQDTKAFNEYCAKNKVTVATLPPNYYVQEDVKLNLRLIITAGSESNKFILEKSKNSDYINAYGPTETTVCATYWKRPEGFGEATAPIGVPIDNFQAFIMNENNLCGIGVPGELCIAGDGLARGYLNRPGLTAEKFVKNPFGEGRMYRTGDFARWLTDGNIEYLGRIDEQVKIRGFRIELGEIESRIREIENIKDCVVIAKADASGDKAIYAYYTSDNEVSVSEIRDRLSERLPGYMIPAYMMQIESIPVTRNGKPDRRALPEIEVITAKEYIAPGNEAEEAVCEAFSEILDVKKVGIQDNFFELGGDSIKAIRIISKLRNTGYTATVKDLMNRKTVEKIAIAIKRNTEEIRYEQGEVTGKVELTPIIKSFEEWKLAKPEHFNQAIMVSVTGIENEVIKQAIEELVKHHDILRAVYRNNELEILPIAESKLCDFYEFDYSQVEDKHKAVEEKCTEIQGNIDLANGPLVKIAVFELGETKQMMFCIHHLVVDGVSWRILSEDFQSAVSQIKAGKKVILPDKTASFIEWSKKLKEYGEKLISNENEYWKKASAKIAEGHVTGEYTETEAGHAVAEFSKETTEKLLTKSGNAYGAKVDEVLLAGLARAVGRITGQKSVGIKLEGHGREEIHEPVLIDRTVGWFTNVYAVSLECSEDNDESIINVKDTIRSIPNMGMGYGYTEHEEEPDICFNYLGDFNEGNVQNIGQYSSGLETAKENDMLDKILINGQTLGEKLSFDIICQKKYGQQFAKQIKIEFEKSVGELAEYCAASKHSSKMTNDNIINNKSNIKLTYDQFIFNNTIDKCLAEYNCEDIASEYVKSITEKEIINLYKLSYAQKHFYEMDNNIVFTKLSAYNINSNDIISILNELIRTQEIFRTAYDINIDKMKVYNYSKIEIPVLNNINNEKWISSIFTTYKGDILNKGGLLSRIFVVKNDYNQFDIYFICHHSISDATSGSIIPELFNNIANGNKNDYLPKRSFSDVIVSKKKLSKNNENKIKVKDFKKALEKFNNALKNENYKYAYIEMEKKCSKAEIAVINNNNLKWLIDMMLELLPDEFCDYIENRLPFILIHNGRTSLDYSTLGMFLSLIIGIYNSENSIDSIIKELAAYRMKDLDIPDHLEVLDDQLLDEMKNVPFFNVQSMRTDFNVEKDSLMVTTTDKFLSEVDFMMNNDQIFISIPILYKNMDNLKEKIFSSLKMKGVYNEKK